MEKEDSFCLKVARLESILQLFWGTHKNTNLFEEVGGNW